MEREGDHGTERRHGQTMARTGARMRGAPETNPALGAAIMEVVE